MEMKCEFSAKMTSWRAKAEKVGGGSYHAVGISQSNRERIGVPCYFPFHGQIWKPKYARGFSSVHPPVGAFRMEPPRLDTWQKKIPFGSTSVCPSPRKGQMGLHWLGHSASPLSATGAGLSMYVHIHVCVYILYMYMPGLPVRALNYWLTYTNPGARDGEDKVNVRNESHIE